MYTKPARKIHRVFVHCSANDNVSLVGDRLVEEIRNLHLATGWSDVGYHYLIDKEGDIHTGRPLEVRPAAQKGWNTDSLAIMIHGLNDFPGPMLSALRSLCQEVHAAHDGKVSFHGHCEVNPNKTCPVIDYVGLLGLSQGGWMR